MDQQIIDALRAIADKFDKWQFPVAVIEFQDGDCETIAVPAAHLTDISWSERGREYATLVTLTRDEVDEWQSRCPEWSEDLRERGLVTHDDEEGWRTTDAGESALDNP